MPCSERGQSSPSLAPPQARTTLPSGSSSSTGGAGGAQAGPGGVRPRPGLGLGRGAGAVGEPDVVALVDGDAGDLAEDPVVGQGLRPEGVYLEGRDVAH